MVCVLNYDEDDNSRRIKNSITATRDVHIIDSSGVPKEGFIPSDEPYYTGNFNKASELFLKSDATYCLYICSDIEGDFDSIIRAVPDNVGVYGPATMGHRYRELRPNGVGIRKVKMVEGAIICVHRKIIEQCHPFKSKYGWAIDLYKCYTARNMGMDCVIDDRNIIKHTQGTTYNKGAAYEDLQLFIESHGQGFKDFIKETRSFLPVHKRLFLKSLNFIKGKGYSI